MIAGKYCESDTEACRFLSDGRCWEHEVPLTLGIDFIGCKRLVLYKKCADCLGVGPRDDERRCRRCTKLKHISRFSKDKREPSGKDIYCKDCRRDINRRRTERKYNEASKTTTEPRQQRHAQQNPSCNILDG